MKISLIVKVNQKYDIKLWKQTLDTILGQELPGNEREILVCYDKCIESYRDKAQKFFHPVISDQSSNFDELFRGCNGEIVFIAEEPFLLPKNYLQVILNEFNQPEIAAVQSRIVNQNEQNLKHPWPSRAGFTYLLRVPYLNGRIFAVRKSAVTPLSFLSIKDSVIQWIDLSWQIIFSPYVICSTVKITAVSLAESDKKHIIRQIYSLSKFFVRWKKELQLRTRRLLIRLRNRITLRGLNLSNSLKKRSGIFSSVGIVIAEGFYLALYIFFFILNFFTTKKISIHRRKIACAYGYTLYPGSFFYQNDFGFYSSRISISEPFCLDEKEKSIIRLFLTENDTHVLRDKLEKLLQNLKISEDEGFGRLVRNDILMMVHK